MVYIIVKNRYEKDLTKNLFVSHFFFILIYQVLVFKDKIKDWRRRRHFNLVLFLELKEMDYRNDDK